jgi:hypothetical protein
MWLRISSESFLDPALHRACAMHDELTPSQCVLGLNELTTRASTLKLFDGSRFTITSMELVSILIVLIILLGTCPVKVFD